MHYTGSEGTEGTMVIYKRPLICFAPGTPSATVVHGILVLVTIYSFAMSASIQGPRKRG